MPSIGYNNLFETGTVSVDSEDASYLKENAYDWLAYPGDVWKPATSGTHYITVDMASAVSADYFGIHSHDIDSIKLQYSNDNFAEDINDVGSAITPTANEIIYSEFASISSRYWRFEVIKVSAASSLGVIALGEKLTIPESVQVGFSPANLARNNMYLNSVSDTGAFLGRRLIRNGSEMDLSFELLTPAFVRNFWDVFIQHAEIKPFFFAWDYANYPSEAFYCWTKKKIPKPVYNLPNFMQAKLKVNANI
ncbi:MAG: hypothetical protein JKY48_15125 [Flavobacteriales bacterium]|nr:hypothetical protein [Flavobacteriales bacterium]